MTQHTCHKEKEITELQTILHNYSNNEHTITTNNYELRLLKEKQEIFEKKYDETIQVIHEINECQQELIKEIVKTNTTFKSLRWSIGIALTIFGGILTFLVVELIKIIH